MIQAVFLHTNSKYSYLPGSTAKMIESIDIDQRPQNISIPSNTVEITDPSQCNAMLKFPGDHPVSVVVAFLKLQKQSGDEFIPVPSEYTYTFSDEI
jgi:hypothetical protein